MVVFEKFWVLLHLGSTVFVTGSARGRLGSRTVPFGLCLLLTSFLLTTPQNDAPAAELTANEGTHAEPPPLPQKVATTPVAQRAEIEPLPAYLVRLEEWRRLTPIEDDFHNSDLLGETGYWFAEMGAADLKGSVNLEVAGRQTNPHLRFDYEVGGGGWQFAYAQLAFWRQAAVQGGSLHFRIRADQPTAIAVRLIDTKSAGHGGWEARLNVDTAWREIVLPLDEHHFTWHQDELPSGSFEHCITHLKGLQWTARTAQSKGSLFLDDLALKAAVP